MYGVGDQALNKANARLDVVPVKPKGCEQQAIIVAVYRLFPFSLWIMIANNLGSLVLIIPEGALL